MHSRRFAFAAVLGLVSLCATRAHSQAAPSPVGLYRLVAIDGHAIPFAPVHPGRPANAGPGPEVLASTMVLRPDGSFIMAMSYRTTTDTLTRYSAQPFSGSWTAQGDGYVARWDGAGTTSLTLARDTLVMNNEGMLFAYRKIR